jgi:hypothetical protein
MAWTLGKGAEQTWTLEPFCCQVLIIYHIALDAKSFDALF